MEEGAFVVLVLLLTHSWVGHDPSLSVSFLPLKNEWFGFHVMWPHGVLVVDSWDNVLRRILKLYPD